MLSMLEAYAPPSSPPVSPTLSADSSPPSSPNHEPMHSNAFSSDGLHDFPMLDPFAGSVKANRPHPSYEKKTPATPPLTPQTSLHSAGPSRTRRDESPISRLRQSHAGGGGVFKTQPLLTPEESRELALWEDAMSSAIAIDRMAALEEEPKKKGRMPAREPKHTIIDLSNQGLTFIPPSISDLAKLVKLPEKEEHAAPVPVALKQQRALMRSATAPAGGSLFGTTRAPAKVTSASAKLFSDDARPEQEIHFFLRGNVIKYLPNEVFTLSHLTVLSLSNNALEVLPPEIVHLTHLKELNIANNKLKYLPAELLTMHLSILSVHPNPWLAPPSPPSVSPTTSLIGRFPPLAELALRALFAPAHEHGLCSALDADGRQPLLTTLYGTPLPPAFASLLPPPISATLGACVPGSVPQPVIRPPRPAKLVRLPRPTRDLGDVCRYWEGVTGVGVCPSPRHLRPKDGRYRKPVFVHPAEERYTWQSHGGGHAFGGVVCFLWRGCLEGCLDFLDGGEVGAEDKEMEMEMEIEMAEAGGFRAVRFEALEMREGANE
ncbi:hypothetical protein GLOTRDRAFT_138258 [Gloeophyllum trabeum ATCC 11539]|uniref:L domain-like protein n=1 Tax=Gloeophyllum trabeum (strain ATCC 11539 / FP-39264 / Madison 617) TaxID=670483 RepID=S7RTT4_GLOTA|nr:uncharacterized protein GLOTRDRAFT_138258 [Gloeophyllum trabeum ATCC 11539]EPQ56559.1 hypothetical protein GLOTRDRAFT_138258 [Gloeophyllum trabeum ATCC 11539]